MDCFGVRGFRYAGPLLILLFTLLLILLPFSYFSLYLSLLLFGIRSRLKRGRNVIFRNLGLLATNAQ